MKNIFGFLILALVMVGCSPDRPHVETLKLNYNGAKLLQEKKFSEAQMAFLEALQYDPFRSGIHLNLGLSFEGLEFPDKALQSYQEAERLAQKEDNKALLFAARFNQGEVLGKQKKIDEALAAYQKALEVLPGSTETKHNIELLIGSSGGQGQGQDDKKQDSQGDQKQQQDKKDGKGQGEQDKKDQQKDSKDQKDQNQDKGKDGKDKDEKKEPQSKTGGKKYVPRPFNGKDLSEGDVKKILGELKQQEGRIRADYNKADGKEQARDKDW